MTFDEAQALKKSLISDTYISSAGNELRIFIVPEEEKGLEVYKSALKYNWQNIKDKVARQYTNQDRFILFGIRQLRNGAFAGGPFEISKHQEMLKIEPVK